MSQDILGIMNQKKQEMRDEQKAQADRDQLATVKLDSQIQEKKSQINYNQGFKNECKDGGGSGERNHGLECLLSGAFIKKKINEQD